MTSTNTKLLLASTALVSAIAVAGVAQATDTVLPASGGITGDDAGSLTHTDANSNSNIDAGETVATNAAITFAAGDNIDVSGATGVSLTIGHNLTGDGSAGAPLVDIGTANNIITVNSGVTLTQTEANAAADGINITGGANNTINVNGTITTNGSAQGIHVSGDVSSTVNVLAGGSSGAMLFDGVSSANYTTSVNISHTGTAGAIRFGDGINNLSLTGGDAGAVTGGTGIDTVTVTGTNQADIAGITLGAGNDSITLSGTDTSATTVGAVDGGAGTDTFTVTSGVNTASTVANIENLTVSGGTLTLSDAHSGNAGDKISVASGATLAADDITGGTADVSVTGSMTAAAAVDIDALEVLAGGSYIGDGTLDSTTGITANGRLYNANALTVDAGGLTVGSTGEVSVTTGALTVTAGDLTVASGGKVTSAANTVVTAGNATVSGTYTEGGTLNVNGANSLLTIANGGSLSVTGAATASSLTVANGGTATFSSTLGTTGNVVVNGTATFTGALTGGSDTAVAGVANFGGANHALGDLSITGKGKVNVTSNGGSGEIDATTVTGLSKINLEIEGTNDQNAHLDVADMDIDKSAALPNVYVAQSTNLNTSFNTAKTFAEIVQGDALATGTTNGETVTVNNGLLTQTWTVDGGNNAWDLSVVLTDTNVATLQGAATGANNKGVAAIVNTGTFSTLYQNVLATSSIDNSLESLTPDTSGGAGAASINTSVASTGTVSNRLALLRGTDNGRSGVAAGEGMMANREMWLQAFGTTVEQDERKGVKGFDATTGGMAIGVDSDEVVKGARVGVAFSYAKADVDSDQANNAQTDIDTYQLSAYGSRDLANDMYVDAMVSYAWNEHEGSRTDFLSDTYEADYDGNQFSVKAEVGKSIDWANTRVTPNFGLHYINVETDGYSETGTGGNGLTVDTDDQNALLVSFGADVEWNHTGRDGSEYMPYLRAKYSYDAIGDEVETTSSFLGGGTAFKSEGADIARHSLGLGTGVNVVTTSGFEFTAGYDAEIKEDFLAHTGMLQARWSF